MEDIEVGYVFLFSPASILLILLYDQSMIRMINNLFELDYPITMLDIVPDYGMLLFTLEDIIMKEVISHIS